MFWGSNMSKSRESRLRDINKKRRRRRRAKMVFFGALVLAVLLVALIYISEIRERTYRAYEVLSSASIQMIWPRLSSYGNGMIRYNRNGLLPMIGMQNPSGTDPMKCKTL